MSARATAAMHTRADITVAPDGRFSCPLAVTSAGTDPVAVLGNDPGYLPLRFERALWAARRQGQHLAMLDADLARIVDRQQQRR